MHKLKFKDCGICGNRHPFGFDGDCRDDANRHPVGPTDTNKTFDMRIEYTDTYGGEANYCWVRRVNLTLPVGISDLAIMRRAKRAVGLSGVRGRTDKNGDSFTFRPHCICTIMFVDTLY